MYKYDERKEKIILPSPEISDVPFDLSSLEHLEPIERKWVLSFISKIKTQNPNWNFNILYNNLQTLTFEQKSLTLERCSGEYDIKKNKIRYSREESIFHELVHASTSIRRNNHYFCGLEQIKKKLRAISIGKGINEGYTNLLESKYDICHGWYVPEMDIAKNLNRSVPSLEELYNNMDLVGLITYLEKYFSRKETLSFLEMIDYIYLHTKVLYNGNPKEIADLYYECQLYTFSCFITKLLQDIENGTKTKEEAQNELNRMFYFTITKIMTGDNIKEVTTLEKLQNRVPDLSNITKDDIKTYKLKL